jgi:hypothetical protein
MSDTIRLRMFLESETDKAVLVSGNREDGSGVGEWIPRSLIPYMIKDGNRIEFDLPVLKNEQVGLEEFEVYFYGYTQVTTRILVWTTAHKDNRGGSGSDAGIGTQTFP